MGETVTPEYIFFIFDEDVMQQSEYDDIEEAVLFYQPKSFFLERDENQVYILFGQLVGIVKCAETLTGALPSIIRLEKTKFVVTRNTHYLLFLGYKSTSTIIPDSSMKKKLKKFLDVFAFYHGSFERLISANKNNLNDFLLDLEVISSNYLAFAQGYNALTQSIFDPLPTIAFDKTSSSIFSKVAQILESCQRRENIYCGCLFAESNVVTSQVSSILVQHLLLLKASQKNKHVSTFYPGFDCPFGVRILRVFVTKQQYEEIIKVSLQSPYSTSYNNHKNTKKHTNDTENLHLRKTTSNSSTISLKEESADRIDTRNLTAMSTITSEILSSSDCNCKDYSHTSCKISINKDLVKTENMDSFDISEKSFNDLQESNSLKTDKTLQNCKCAENKTNLSFNECCDTYLKTDKLSDQKDLPRFYLTNMITHLDVNDTNHIPIPVLEEKEIDLSLGAQKQILDNMHELHLYVQAHSDVVLVLFMEVKETYEYQNLRSLWEMLLPHLGELEAQVKSLLSMREENEPKRAANICFVKYDNVIRKCETNISEIINADDLTFINAVSTIHHQFESSSSVSDITFIKSNSTHGYAHKSPIEELYLQQRGNYKPSQGSPSNTESLWRLDQQAGNKLKKLTSNLLL